MKRINPVTKLIKDVESFANNMPVSQQVKFGHKFIQPLEWLSDPVLLGLENIPDDKPVLFVGNHTLMGLLDSTVMWFQLYHQKGIFTHVLADHIHTKIPIWNSLIKMYGATEGTRENCGELMRQGKHVLVFPGGVREVFKNKGEKYKLIWKKRLGFARMAIEHSYTIIPFAAVGAEECYDIIYDNKQIQKTPVGKLLKAWGVREDILFPIVKGFGATLLPKPQRFYYKFGNPISTTQYEGDYKNDINAKDLKARVKFFVEEGIEELLAFRADDPKRNFANRLFSKIIK
ncbi:MAG: acyltransferase family protein [Aureispira sp.]|nr:acyltransferase family protein [Aureispira sp.]